MTDQAPAEIAPGQRIRFTDVDDDENWTEFGFSMPADATQIQIDEAKVSVRAISDSIRTFNSRPEAEQLQYYLAVAVKALREVLDIGGIGVRDDLPWGDPIWSKYSKKLADAMCIADMALIQIPNRYRKTDIKISCQL